MTAGRAAVMSKPTVTAGPVVSDSFDRADSATTMGNADTGQTWVPNSGTWGIASNLAYPVTTGGEATTVVDSTLADCTIHVICVITGGDAGLCWRSTDSNNHFLLAQGAGTVYKKEGGGYTEMGDAAGWSDGDTMTVVVVGDSHTIKKNGSTVISYTSAFNQSATKHGLRAGATSSSRWNDFSVAA